MSELISDIGIADVRQIVNRYLIEVTATDRDILSSIAVSAEKKIIRIKLRGAELDVQTEDIYHVLEELEKSVIVSSWREIKEEEPLPKPSLTDVNLALVSADELCKEERFWEAHVTLESVWRNSQSNVRSFLQTIIQLFASQVHEQMGNHQTAFAIYSKAVQKLRENIFLLRANQTIPDQFEYPLRLNLIAIAKSL